MLFITKYDIIGYMVKIRILKKITAEVKIMDNIKEAWNYEPIYISEKTKALIEKNLKVDIKRFSYRKKIDNYLKFCIKNYIFDKKIREEEKG